MPRGRPKKQPAEAKPELSAVEVLKQALSAAAKEDPKAVSQILEDVGIVVAGTRRTVENPEGKRTVAVRQDEIPVPEPMKPADPSPAVVFKSPHNNLKLVLERSKKIHYGDDWEIVPPKLVEFESGTARVTDPDDARRVRAIYSKYIGRGIKPTFVEIRDEIAEARDAEIKPVRSKKGVTAETPVDEVLVEAEA